MLRVTAPSLPVLALVLAGCGSADASGPPPTPTNSTTSTTTPSSTACDSSATLNLRTPAGETLNLTGYWVSGETQNAFWRIAHYGTCMAWVGEMVQPDVDPATAFSFSGTLRNDFTIDGEWFLLPHGRPIHTEIDSGHVTFRLIFGPSGTSESVQLILESGGAAEFENFGPFGHGNGTIWVRYTGN